MILVPIVVILFLTSIFALGLWIARTRRIFCRTRLCALSLAAESDSIGGVGISLLCPSPASAAVVVALLDTRYPLSEVVVAVDPEQQSNLLSQLKLRYSLLPCSAEGCVVYRSRLRTFRRLVVVVTSEKSLDSQCDLAAQNALFDYLLRVPSDCRIFPFAVGRIAESLAAQPIGQVDVVTTAECGVTLLSRTEWRERGGFGAALMHPPTRRNIHIAEPLVFVDMAEKGQQLLVERSRYNFWDFLALNIMKYRNKLLSLRKP